MMPTIRGWREDGANPESLLAATAQSVPCTTPEEEVLRLARRLFSADQARLRAALSPAGDEDAERAIQRQRNQAAIDLLDLW